jgi:hypothetical protein
VQSAAHFHLFFQTESSRLNKMNKLYLPKIFGTLAINITDIGQYRMRLPAGSENTIRVKRLEGANASSFPRHLSPVVKKIKDLTLLPWILKIWLHGARTGGRYAVHT